MECESFSFHEQEALQVKLKELEAQYACDILSKRIALAQAEQVKQNDDRQKSLTLFLQSAMQIMEAALQKEQMQSLQAKDEYASLLEHHAIHTKKVEDAAAKILESRKEQIADQLGVECGFGADVLADQEGAKAID